MILHFLLAVALSNLSIYQMLYIFLLLQSLFLSIHVSFPSAVSISTQSIYLLIFLSNALSFSSPTESFLSIHISFPSAVPISTQSIYLLIYLSNALSFSSPTESFLSICVVSVSFYFGRANIRNESKQKSAKNLTGNFFAFHI